MTYAELELSMENTVFPERLKCLSNAQLKELPEIVKEYRRSIEVGINDPSEGSSMFRMFDGLDILICLDMLSTMEDEELSGKSRTSPMLAFGIYTSNTTDGSAEAAKFNELKLSTEFHKKMANLIENYYGENYIVE